MAELNASIVASLPSGTALFVSADPYRGPIHYLKIIPVYLAVTPDAFEHTFSHRAFLYYAFIH